MTDITETYTMLICAIQTADKVPNSQVKSSTAMVASLDLMLRSNKSQVLHKGQVCQFIRMEQN